MRAYDAHKSFTLMGKNYKNVVSILMVYVFQSILNRCIFIQVMVAHSCGDYAINICVQLNKLAE